MSGKNNTGQSAGEPLSFDQSFSDIEEEIP